ncbi:MAG: hypothetical protein OEV78_01220 [Spirochaetia bacterium]|nr:hypothetical protein [Spirochaetia bacterium]
MKNNSLNIEYDILSSDDPIEEMPLKINNFINPIIDLLHPEASSIHEDINHLELTEDEIDDVLTKSDTFHLDMEEIHDDFKLETSNHDSIPSLNINDENDNEIISHNDFDFTNNSYDNIDVDVTKSNIEQPQDNSFETEFNIDDNEKKDTSIEDDFFEETEEGPIALSDEELESALSDTSSLTADTLDTTEKSNDNEVSLEDEFDFTYNPDDNIDVDAKKSNIEQPQDNSFETEFNIDDNEKKATSTDDNFFEETDEGPIALSDEELESALSETSSLTADSLDTNEKPNEKETSLDDEFDFSYNPHDNIDVDAKKSNIEQPQDNSFETEFNIDDNEKKDTSIDDNFFEETDEGPIALSDEELESALSNTENATSDQPIILEDVSNQEISLEDDFDFSFKPDESKNGEIEKSSNNIEQVNDDLFEKDMKINESNTDDSMEKNFFEENEDEPITLSEEELENTLMEPEPSQKNYEGNEIDEKLNENFDIPVFDDELLDETESVNSSDDENTSNTISDADKAYKETSQQVDSEEDNEWEIELTPDDYKKTPEIKQDLEVKPSASNDASDMISDEEGKVNFHEESNVSLPNRDELKKVVAYLDNLLGELPDELIEKFAKSEYFKLYQKVMEDLGL